MRTGHTATLSRARLTDPGNFTVAGRFPDQENLMPKTTGNRSKPDLRLVAESEVYDLMRGPQTTADRVKQLQAEARALAVEQVEALEKILNVAAEISKGGDAYPVGAREIASRLAEDLPAKAETIKVIVSRLP
jgi:hypothetical protein